MTALERYERLEAIGLWRETPDAVTREVIVSFGDATLVLRDPMERPLTHWALAGTQIVNHAEGATILSTDADGYETLAIRDPEMLEAIAAVTTRVAPAQSSQARSIPWVRAVFWVILFAGLVGVAAVRGPDVIRAQAVRMLPPSQAEVFAERIASQLIAARGPVCAEPAGERALAAITDRVAKGALSRVDVLDLDGTPVAALPGLLLLDRTTLMDAASADEVAGWIALGLSMGSEAVPRMMEAVRLRPALRYIFTGKLGAQALRRAGSAALVQPPAGHLGEAAARLDLARIDPADFERAVARAGIGAMEGAAPRSGKTATPALGDQDWVALQGICG